MHHNRVHLISQYIRDFQIFKLIVSVKLPILFLLQYFLPKNNCFPFILIIIIIIQFM